MSHPSNHDPFNLDNFDACLLQPHADLAPTSRATINRTRTLWERFADAFDLPTSVASINADNLAAYTTARLQTGIRHNTVERDLWALTRDHQHATSSHTAIDAPARAVIRGWLHNNDPKPVRQAAVLPRWFLAEMFTAIRDDEPGYDHHGAWRAARDRAALAVAYAGALRAGSLDQLQHEQLRRRSCSWRLHLPTSKGNQPSANGWLDETIDLTTQPAPLDPVAALDSWLDIRGTSRGALFPAHPGEYAFPVTARVLRERLQAVAERCGDQHGAFTLAGLRRTWATHARLEGASIADIGRHLLHRSDYVTHRYVANLRVHVSDGDAARYYLPTVRPDDATYDLGQQATNTFGTGWTPPDTDLETLRHDSENLASQGAVAAAPNSRKTARQVRARFDTFCNSHSLDPHAGDEDVVVAFAAHEYGLNRPEGPRLRAITLRRYLDALALSWQLDDPTAVPPVGKAITLADNLVQREGAAPQTQATIPQDGELTVKQLIEAETYSTRHLDLAVLRWHAHRAGLKLTRPGRTSRPSPWQQLTSETVTVADDTVTLAADNKTVQLAADDNLETCPVRAAQRLLDAAPAGDQLLSTISLDGNGTELRRSLGLSSRVESWSRGEFEQAASWLASELRRQHRDRMVFAVLYAGALRGADLRSARIEDLERYPFGYKLHMRVSKENRRGEPETVALHRRDDALCPVVLIDAFLNVWPFDHGPLLPGRTGDRTHGRETPPERMCRSNLLHLIDRRADIVGEDVTGHSFRRLAATLLWEETEDLDEVQRLLRHRSQRYTRRYVGQLTPGRPTSPAHPADVGAEVEL